MPTRLRANPEGRRRQRELSGPERAGAFARRKAREMQRRFLRSHWRVLLVAALAGELLVVPAVFLFDGFRLGLFVGILSTVVIGLLAHLVVVFSGSASALMGDVGEQWTMSEMRRLQPKGWKVIHRLLLRAYEDVDSVAIGPAGVVVLETKWSAENWQAPSHASRIRAAATQARSSAGIVASVTRTAIGRVPVHTAVVLWPSDETFDRREVDGVTVISGHELVEWINTLPKASIADVEATAAWSLLSQHLRKRDAFDQDKYGPMPKSINDYLMDTGQFFGGLLGSLLLLALVLRGLDWRLSAPSIIVFASGAGALTRVVSLRRIALGATVGSGLVAVAVVAIIGAAYLTSWAG